MSCGGDASDGSAAVSAAVDYDGGVEVEIVVIMVVVVVVVVVIVVVVVVTVAVQTCILFFTATAWSVELLLYGTGIKRSCNSPPIT